RHKGHLVGAGGVDYGSDVVHPSLECRKLVQPDRVRHARPALVEEDQPTERSQASEEAGVVALFPLPLDVVPPVAHEHDADGPVPDDLVRDVPLLGVRVARLGNVDHAASSWQRPGEPTGRRRPVESGTCRSPWSSRRTRSARTTSSAWPRGGVIVGSPSRGAGRPASSVNDDGTTGSRPCSAPTFAGLSRPPTSPSPPEPRRSCSTGACASATTASGTAIRPKRTDAIELRTSTSRSRAGRAGGRRSPASAASSTTSHLDGTEPESSSSATSRRGGASITTSAVSRSRTWSTRSSSGGQDGSTASTEPTTRDARNDSTS